MTCRDVTDSDVYLCMHPVAGRWNSWKKLYGGSNDILVQSLAGSYQDADWIFNELQLLAL